MATEQGCLLSFGPAVHCENSNSSVISRIDAAAREQSQRLGSSVKEISQEFLALVPTTRVSNFSPSYLLNSDLADTTKNAFAADEIWLRYSGPLNGTVISTANFSSSGSLYLTCGLHNASYNINISWSNGRQSISQAAINLMNPVNPTKFTDADAGNQNAAYTAFMRAFSSQIVGYISFHQDVNSSSVNHDANIDVYANRTYSSIDTNLASTILIGTSSLDAFLKKNHALAYLYSQNPGPPPEDFSPQRLYDMDLARNRSLDLLIPELSFNTCISMISNPRFAPS